MSIDYTFNKKISLDEIKLKTSLIIKEENDKKWIVDEYNNHMVINSGDYYDADGNNVDSPTLELSVYGCNNSKKIRDELIKYFDVKFITDNELEGLYRNPEEWENIDNIFDDVMNKYGYFNDGKIVVPVRSDDEYKPFK